MIRIPRRRRCRHSEEFLLKLNQPASHAGDLSRASNPFKGTLNALSDALAGRYTIERALGEGASASVWLAEDLRHGRRVAIKLLRPELAAMLGVDRFLLEIQIAARLNHPHILPLFDSGEVMGVPYYVMPYVVGESLRTAMDRERPFPVENAVRLVAEVADALGRSRTSRASSTATSSPRISCSPGGTR